MVHQQSQPNQHQHAAKRLLIGAGIGLALISVFLIGVKNPDPSWPEYWMVRPLVLVPIAGAGGALFFHLTQHLRVAGGWKAMFVNLIALVVFIIALWIGIVAGLDGTLWN